MTVTSETRLIEYTADGVQREWPFTFVFYSLSHVRLFQWDEGLGLWLEVSAGDFALTATPSTNLPGFPGTSAGFPGGLIEWPKAPAAVAAEGTRLRIERRVPYTQTGIDLTPASGFDPLAVMREFDLQVMRIQQVRAEAEGEAAEDAQAFASAAAGFRDEAEDARDLAEDYAIAAAASAAAASDSEDAAALSEAGAAAAATSAVNAAIAELGTAADEDVEAFATAAQGALADTAVQPVTLTAAQADARWQVVASGTVTNGLIVSGLGEWHDIIVTATGVTATDASGRRLLRVGTSAGVLSTAIYHLNSGSAATSFIAAAESGTGARAITMQITGFGTTMAYKPVTGGNTSSSSSSPAGIATASALDRIQFLADVGSLTGGSYIIFGRK